MNAASMPAPVRLSPSRSRLVAAAGRLTALALVVFYLIQFMTSTPIVALAIEGRNAINLVRLINGATKPTESEPGSIRGDFSIDITHNVVHASDSPENAERELGILFDSDEILEYRRIDEAITYSPEL